MRDEDDVICPTGPDLRESRCCAIAAPSDTGGRLGHLLHTCDEVLCVAEENV